MSSSPALTSEDFQGKLRLMKRIIFVVVLFLLYAFSVTRIQASLIVIDPQGVVVWNVLSSQDEVDLEIPRRDFLEVRNIGADADSASAVKISLRRIDGHVQLKVASSEGEKELDVTDYTEDLVEIEERPELTRLKIGLIQDKFSIQQKGVVALTEFPISIDPATAQLSVETPTGAKYLSILPHQAVESTLRSKTINRFSSGQKVPLIEAEHGELVYTVSGNRVINLLNLFSYKVPVSVDVSASTGEIVSVTQPTWLKVFGFLFA